MSRDVSSLSTILEGPILEGSTLGARAWMKIAVLAFGLATAGCRGGRGDLPPAQTPTDGQGPQAQTARPSLSVDRARMLEDIEYLADDALGGRYTLDEELKTAARWIAERHAALKLEPVGAAYEVPFSLVTGARVLEPARVELTSGKRTRTAKGKTVGAAAISGSGSVTGPLVFVGYAAKAEPVEGAPADPETGDKGTMARPGYDDLAGVDLKGKIAVVLLEVPGRPDLRSFFKVLQAEIAAFDEALKPLKEKSDADGLRALHRKTRGRLMAMIAPFLRGLTLGDDFWPMPEDPQSLVFDMQAVLGGVLQKAQEIPGPQFDFQSGSLKDKVKRLTEAGAVGVITVRGPRSFVNAEGRAKDTLPDLASMSPTTLEPGPRAPVVQMQWKEADRLLRVGGKKLSAVQEEIDATLEPRSGPVDGEATATIAVKLEPVTAEVPNVIAKIPGTDLADELVVLGAHYDHIGKGGDGEQGQCAPIKGEGEATDAICNGADDNASGTAMLLEIARAYMTSGRRPRRTIVFAHFAGEELGLYGSKAMVDAPPFPLAQVKAMVNLDMVGRLDRRGLAVGGLSSSDQWMPLLDQLGNHGMKILYEGGVATRSDHASFYKQKIPVLFFFTGVHSDYHRASDHADKINVEGLGTIGALVGEVILALGDGYELAYREPGPDGGLMQGLPGSNPKSVVKRVSADE